MLFVIVADTVAVRNYYHCCSPEAFGPVRRSTAGLVLPYAEVEVTVPETVGLKIHRLNGIACLNCLDSERNLKRCNRVDIAPENRLVINGAHEKKPAAMCSVDDNTRSPSVKLKGFGGR